MSALLAGLIQQPSYRNPYGTPIAPRERRNVVLQMMRENGFVSEAQYGWRRTSDQADAAEMESTVAPYFVDLVERGAAERVRDYDFQANTYRVYTTVDLKPPACAIRRRAHRNGGSGPPAQPPGWPKGRSRPRPSARWWRWIPKRARSRP